jgi:hypothetical protein
VSRYGATRRDYFGIAERYARSRELELEPEAIAAWLQAAARQVPPVSGAVCVQDVAQVPAPGLCELGCGSPCDDSGLRPLGAPQFASGLAAIDETVPASVGSL